MTLEPPFFIFSFFHTKTADPKCKKVCLYGKNRCKNLSGIYLCPPFAPCPPNALIPSALIAKVLGKNSETNRTFLPCRKIQKLWIFGQKSQKTSQNLLKSRGLRTPCNYHALTTQCEGRATQMTIALGPGAAVRRTLPALHPLPCQPIRPQPRPPHHHRRKLTRPRSTAVAEGGARPGRLRAVRG